MKFGRKKNGLVARTSRLVEMNLHALLDRAEDPEKVADQLIREYTGAMEQTSEAVARTIAALRVDEKRQLEAQASVDEWEDKARAALTRVETSTTPSEKARYETLARRAVASKIKAEKKVAADAPVIAEHRETVEGLQEGLVLMGDKLDELRSRKAGLAARDSVAEAQMSVVSAVSALSGDNPASAMSQLESRVEQKEALAAGRAEVAAARLTTGFESLEDGIAEAEADRQLEEIRRSMTGEG